MKWSKKERRDYDDEEDRIFRHYVRERDRVCQFPECYCDSKKLQVHHIVRWVDAEHLRYDVTNGILLCKEAHETVTGNEWIYASMLQEIVNRNEENFKRH